MMKKLIYVFAAFVLISAAVSCGEKTDPTPSPGPDVLSSVEGCWELTDVKTKASVGSEVVSVYMKLSAGKFELYQKLGSSAAHYAKFTGSYSFSGGKLSGSYDGGKSLGSTYTVTFSSSTMSLETAGGKEVDVYKKIQAIPDVVLSDVI